MGGDLMEMVKITQKKDDMKKENRGGEEGKTRIFS
jgi:hypothetical protein